MPKHVKKLEKKGMDHVKSIRCTWLVHLRPPPFGLQYIITSSFSIFPHHLFSLISLPTLLLLPLSNEISLQLTLFCVVATTSRLKGRRSMKNSSSLGPHASFLLATLCLLLTLGKGLRFTHHHYISSSFHEKGTYDGDQSHVNPQEGEKEEEDMRVYPTGSSLPDCSHACGPCFPCKRVMVSFKCSVAESCPIVYRCTCKGKYYHVPSN